MYWKIHNTFIEYRRLLSNMATKLGKKMTIIDFIHYVESYFNDHELYYGHGTDNAFDEAAYIVLSMTKNLPLIDEAVYDNEIDSAVQKEILTCIERRVDERIPAAYLLGEAWFAGLPFYVDENVLVPRSPFAELIADEFLPWVNYSSTNNILDLCSGSGCIGIASALVFTEANVDLADISVHALDVARKNVSRYKLADRVSVIESNLYEGLQGQKYDLIVSNPPYVSEEELSGLPEEYCQEPKLGLDGGETGLDLVHHILAYADVHLTEQGVLYVEVGNTDVALQACYPNVPFLWIDFEQGGHGVFMLTKQQLEQYKEQFMVNVNS